MLKPKTSLTFDESIHAKIECLYDTYYDNMLRFAKNKLKKSGILNYEIDAEDAVQNAFLKIIKYRDKLKDVPEITIRAYVLAIVSNVVSDMVSAERHCVDIEEYADSLADEDFIEKMNIRESYQSVVEALLRMDEKYGMTLIRYFCYDMSVKEMAKTQGISENTVYSRLSRGKLILLKTIKEAPF